MLQRSEEAAEQLRKAISLAPKDPIIWEHLGDVLIIMGDKKGAREAYENSLKIKPDSETVPGKLDELD